MAVPQPLPPAGAGVAAEPGGAYVAVVKPEVKKKSAWIAFGLLLVAAFALATVVFLPLWKPAFLAAVLATATYGLYQRLRRRLGDRPRVAGGLMTFGVVVLLLIPVAVILTVAVREGIEAYAFVRGALREGGVQEVASRLPDRIAGPVRRLFDSLPVDRAVISDGAAGTGAALARVARDVIAGVSRILFSTAMMLIAYFAMLTEGPRLLAWIEDASPLRGRQTIELLSEFRAVTQSVLRSTTLTAATQAAVATVGYLIAGIPNAVFFGFLTFFAAFIPSVGTAIVAIPLTALLLLLGQTWQGIFLGVWAVAVVGLVDNLLKPLLMRGGMHLHGVVIFFALVGGVIAFGGIGLLVGPLSVTFLLTMIRFGYRDFSTKPKGEPEDVPAPAKAGDV